MKSTFDPANVKLSELKHFRRLHEQQLPELEHYLWFILDVLHNISCIINQVARTVGLTTIQVNFFASNWVYLEDDLFGLFVPFKSTNYVRDLELLPLVVIKEWYAAIRSKLFLLEAYMFSVVDNVAALVDQVAAHVYRPVKLVGVDSKFVCQPDWYLVSLLVLI